VINVFLNIDAALPSGTGPPGLPCLILKLRFFEGLHGFGGEHLPSGLVRLGSLAGVWLSFLCIVPWLCLPNPSSFPFQGCGGGARRLLTSVKLGGLKSPTPHYSQTLGGGSTGTYSKHSAFPPSPKARKGQRGGGDAALGERRFQAMITRGLVKGRCGVLKSYCYTKQDLGMGGFECLLSGQASSSPPTRTIGGRSGCSPAQLKHISQRRKRNQLRFPQ
jgi:hypothetical protein